MIGYSLILAPLLLRKLAGLPGSDTSKHLFADRFIFDHRFFSCKIIDAINTEQQAFTGGLHFKDKYLLLDFWASWCAPCRENTPSIRWLYNKYKGNGLKVLSISLDKDNTKWKDAIKADTMSWLQGSDLMGEEGGVGFQFQIISIPQYVLLAPDGKIIFNFSNGDVDSLEEKLKQIFN